ncbi:MAG: preprotein translocase subunit SecE [Candidatus Magasanikbacteria bacterium]
MTILEKIKDYFKGAFREMKKVVWPSKKQTTTYTIIVIGMSIGVAIFFGILDYAFNIVLGWII